MMEGSKAQTSAEKTDSDMLDKIPVEYLNLSTHECHCLKGAKAMTIGAVDRRRDNLYRFRNLGRLSEVNILKALERVQGDATFVTRITPLLTMPVSSLNLSENARKWLASNHLETVDDVIKWRYDIPYQFTDGTSSKKNKIRAILKEFFREVKLISGEDFAAKFMNVLEPPVLTTNEKKAPCPHEDHPKRSDIDNLSVVYLNLTPRAYHCLKIANVMTIGDADRKRGELNRFRNLGQKTEAEITRALDRVYNDDSFASRVIPLLTKPLSSLALSKRTINVIFSPETMTVDAFLKSFFKKNHTSYISLYELEILENIARVSGIDFTKHIKKRPQRLPNK